VVVFLRGLPPRLGARNAGVGEVREVFRQALPVVQLADAFLGDGTIFHRDQETHFMDPSAFIANNRNAVLNR